jgi:hypothetical protein
MKQSPRRQVKLKFYILHKHWISLEKLPAGHFKFFFVGVTNEI